MSADLLAALLTEDSVFGDLHGAASEAVIGLPAAMSPSGAVVPVERCYAIGIAQVAITAVIEAARESTARTADAARRVGIEVAGL